MLHTMIQNKKAHLITIMSIIGSLYLVTGCDNPSKENRNDSNESEMRAIYESAPQKRQEVDKAVSESTTPIRVNQNTEASKLESILRNNGFIDPTVTEGVKETGVKGYIWKLEVIDGPNSQDYYVEMTTNIAITSGTVSTKKVGSPW